MRTEGLDHLEISKDPTRNRIFSMVYSENRAWQNRAGRGDIVLVLNGIISLICPPTKFKV
jgi:hypothetical protein